MLETRTPMQATLKIVFSAPYYFKLPIVYLICFLTNKSRIGYLRHDYGTITSLLDRKIYINSKKLGIVKTTTPFVNATTLVIWDFTCDIRVSEIKVISWRAAI